MTKSANTTNVSVNLDSDYLILGMLLKLKQAGRGDSTQLISVEFF